MLPKKSTSEQTPLRVWAAVWKMKKQHETVSNQLSSQKENPHSFDSTADGGSCPQVVCQETPYK